MNTKIQAQALYNLRTLTGFISGTDLHDLFRDVLEGEPSPSGYEAFEVSALTSARYGEEALAELQRPLREVVADIAWYVIGSPVSPEEDMRMDAAIAHYRQQEPVGLLNTVREEFGANETEITAEMVKPLFEETMQTVIGKISEMVGMTMGFRWN